MKFNDTLIGAALLALALSILSTVQTYPVIPGQNIGPGAFPGLLATLLAVCAVLLIFKGIKAKTMQRESWVEIGGWVKSWFHLRNFLITIGCLLFYIYTSDKLGFLITAVIITATMFWALEVRRKLIFPIAIIVAFVIHTIFYKGLRVPLPWGLLTPFQW
jgi:putative tricarboxylic transport membrane protein